jgi:hypothetical protein
MALRPPIGQRPSWKIVICGQRKWEYRAMTVEQEQIAQNATCIEGVDLDVATKPIDSGFASRKLKHRWLVTRRV